MKEKLLKNKWFIYEGVYLVFIELFNQLLITKTVPIRLHSLSMYGITLLFDIIWTLLVFAILSLFKYKTRKIIAAIINILLLIIAVVNYFIYSYFHLVFSWKDLLLTGEGLSFLSSIYKYINFGLIFVIIIAGTLIILLVKTKIESNKQPKLIVIIICILTLLGARYLTQRICLASKNDGWNSLEVANNYANNYIEWIDSPKILRISGTYEYLVRDFYFSFLKKNNILKAKKEAEEYIENNKNNYATNEYSNIFKDKNLIFVMMEAMDDWLVNEKVTPTIYEMMHHGFNFTNHYSPAYVTGATANTEFIANSGMYPNINKLSPNYAFVNNTYPYSLANLFKKDGYITNSYHRSSGFIYNRDNMHISLGYTKYHSYLDLNIAEENINLDSYLIENGYDKIIQSDKFMSFIITYSPHSPYSYDKEECTTHLDEIKKIYPNEDNEEILCAYSAARETDEMFKTLLDKLESDKILDDTVIIAFADHPNKVLIREDETEKLNKTIFFIYSSDMSNHGIDKITSSINILPTVINLFGLDTSYVYPGYDALSDSSGYVIFDDYTYYDGLEIKNITNKMHDEIDYSINLLVSDYYKEK